MTTDSRVAALLKQKIGLDIASIGSSAIERALRLRVTALKLNDQKAYWETLSVSPDEQQALVEAVVVPETWFFRYPDSFRALADIALQRVVRSGRPLRLLSAPCSTGEEPYSIVMALLDAGLLTTQFSVDAIDISPALLTRAGKGIYGRNSFRGKSLEFRDRYFSEAEGSFRLQDRVREQVRLLPANLLDPGFLAAEKPYDIVFCRNLLIYFDLPTQEAALSNLRRKAVPDGFLFVGPAEANLLSQHGLESVGVAHSFAFSLSAAQKPVKKTVAMPPLSATAKPVAKPAPQAAVSSAQKATASPPASKPAGVAKATVPVKTSVPAKTPLSAKTADCDDIAALANAGHTGQALEACDRHLREHGPSATLFYWYGVLNEAAGRPGSAQDYYRKALYLDPQHPESLAQLAALLAARGDTAGARRLQERAARGTHRNG